MTLANGTFIMMVAPAAVAKLNLPWHHPAAYEGFVAESLKLAE